MEILRATLLPKQKKTFCRMGAVAKLKPPLAGETMVQNDLRTQTQKRTGHPAYLLPGYLNSDIACMETLPEHQVFGFCKG